MQRMWMFKKKTWKHCAKIYWSRKYMFAVEIEVEAKWRLYIFSSYFDIDDMDMVIKLTVHIENGELEASSLIKI